MHFNRLLYVTSFWIFATCRAEDGTLFSPADIQRNKCEWFEHICYGRPIDQIYLDSVASAIQGGEGLTDESKEVATCMSLGLFECKSPRAYLRSPKPVVYATDKRFADRYFTLRRFQYTPRRGTSKNDALVYCLFFRRNRVRDPFGYITCETCSQSSLVFESEPRCFDPWNELWRSTKFRHTLHHNFAVIAQSADATPINDIITAFGGQYPGIWRLTAKPPVMIKRRPPPTHNWTVEPRVEINRFHPGCIDLMAGWNGICTWSRFLRSCRFPHCGCEFDGKLSVVEFKGRLLLYARANIKPNGGGRFVQVAFGRPLNGECSNDNSMWGHFSLINIIGYDAWQSDIYIFLAQVNPVDRDTLVALFPVRSVSNGSSSIAMSFTQDGVWWSPIVDLISSSVSAFGEWRGRNMDHPVDGMSIADDGRFIYLYVHHTVPGIVSTDSGRLRPTGVFQYTMMAETMYSLTFKAKSQLASARQKHFQQDPTRWCQVHGDSVNVNSATS